MSVATLTRSQRTEAKRLIKLSCARLLADPANVHYTQGPNRWDAIAHRKGIHKTGFWPFYGDCSSTATWVLWRAIWVPFRMPDVVNGEHWQAGYTGTMLDHGEPRNGKPQLGDLVIYGHGAPGEHVAVSLGDGTVLSHGSEGGPYRLPTAYRPDVLSIRRYF